MSLLLCYFLCACLCTSSYAQILGVLPLTLVEQQPGDEDIKVHDAVLQTNSMRDGHIASEAPSFSSIDAGSGVKEFPTQSEKPADEANAEESHIRPEDSLSEMDPEPFCLCTLINLPVCASDGVTYSNECTARCGGAIVLCDGECPCPKEEKDAEVTQDPVVDKDADDGSAHEVDPLDQDGEVQCMCALFYAPICGADGKTYSNDCSANCSKIVKACDGECPCNAEDGACPNSSFTSRYAALQHARRVIAKYFCSWRVCLSLVLRTLQRGGLGSAPEARSDV